jgi:hypothetical protein
LWRLEIAGKLRKLPFLIHAIDDCRQSCSWLAARLPRVCLFDLSRAGRQTRWRVFWLKVAPPVG